MPDPISLGRIAPPPEHWPSIAAQIALAPEITDEGVSATKSFNLWRWRHPRDHAQLAGRGCCVGESIADMLELNARVPDDLSVPIPGPIVPGMPALSPLWIYWVARDYSARHGRPIRGDGAIVSDALMAVMESGVIAWEHWPGTEANYRDYTDRSPPQSALDAPRIKVSGECLRLTSLAQLVRYLCERNLAAVVGTPWRGGFTTGRDGSFSWDRANQGGHAYTISGIDVSSDRLNINNSWDNARWGVQSAAGSGEARGWGYTSFRAWSQAEFSSADLSSGATECVVIEGLKLEPPLPPPDPQPKPDPTPPQPTPPPTPTPNPPPAPGPATPGVPTSWSGHVIAADGRLYEVTQTVKRLT